MAAVLGVRALNRATLARQLLLAREQCTVVSAVERLCGMQAQEPKPPFIGLWSRVEGFERADLRRALEAREVVRGTLLRGTLHLLSAGDFVAFRAPIQPVLEQGLGLLGDRAEGLDVAALLPVARALLLEQPRTFNELRALLLEAFPQVNDRALGFAVRMLLPLVMVPTDDAWGFRSVSAFTLADEWLGRPIGVNADHGPLLRRYLAAFGPATAADAQTFTGVKGLAASFELHRPELVVFRDERGRELFDLPDAPRPDEG
ncbi:MAG: winged helix DNA-binding domain-containing protein, partial [Gaiellales bacterium]